MIPKKGTPQREHRDEYQKKFRSNYIFLPVSFKKRDEGEMAIYNALRKLPDRTKTEWIKTTLATKLREDGLLK